MKRKRLFLRLITAIVMLCACLFSWSSCSSTSEEGGMSWRNGMFTTLSLSLFAESGEVSAVVRNDFTLGFSTVRAYVYLYSSEEYTENYEAMTLEAKNDASDLNIFCELRAAASTGGISKYWVARMRYRANNNVWKEAVTIPLLVDGRGAISA